MLNVTKNVEIQIDCYDMELKEDDQFALRKYFAEWMRATPTLATKEQYYCHFKVGSFSFDKEKGKNKSKHGVRLTFNNKDVLLRDLENLTEKLIDIAQTIVHHKGMKKASFEHSINLQTSEDVTEHVWGRNYQ